MKVRGSLVAAGAAVVMLLAGCATADLSVDSKARVTGTISVDMGKDNLATANVTTLDGFRAIIGDRLAKAPGAGQLFANAVYSETDTNFNVTATYSNSSFDDAASTYARVKGSRIVFSMDTSIFDPSQLAIPAAPDSAGTVDLSSATITITVKFPGKLYRTSTAGATRVDARTVKWEGSSAELGTVTASSRRR